MGVEWRDCIVTFIDLIGVRSDAHGAAGSTLMRRLHKVVVNEIENGKYSIANVCAWNDSVLVLSYVNNENASYQDALHDVDSLKKEIDKIRKSYAIAVKGRAFPPVHENTAGGIRSRVIVIEASSWAMANCFEIEKKLRNLRKSWYIDGRIARKIRTSQSCQKHKVPLYPSGQPRDVYAYEGYLWS